MSIRQQDHAAAATRSTLRAASTPVTASDPVTRMRQPDREDQLREPGRGQHGQRHRALRGVPGGQAHRGQTGDPEQVLRAQHRAGHEEQQGRGQRRVGRELRPPPGAAGGDEQPPADHRRGRQDQTQAGRILRERHVRPAQLVRAEPERQRPGPARLPPDHERRRGDRFDLDAAVVLVGQEADRGGGEGRADRSQHHRRRGQTAALLARSQPGQQRDRPYLDRRRGPDQGASEAAPAGHAPAGRTERGDGKRDGQNVEPADHDRAEQRHAAHPVPGPGQGSAAPGPCAQHEGDGQVAADGQEHEVFHVAAGQAAGQPEGQGRAGRILPHRVGYREPAVGETAGVPLLVQARVAVPPRDGGGQVKARPRREPDHPQHGRRDDLPPGH